MAIHDLTPTIEVQIREVTIVLTTPTGRPPAITIHLTDLPAVADEAVDHLPAAAGVAVEAPVQVGAGGIIINIFFRPLTIFN